MVEMGYEPEVVIPILKKTNSDIHKALDIIKDTNETNRIVNEDKSKYTDII